MTWLFPVILVLMIVAVALVVGVGAYYTGMWNERKAWNKVLGLPERTDRPYFTVRDIGRNPRVETNDDFPAFRTKRVTGRRTL